MSNSVQAPSAALRRARVATACGFFLQALILVTILSRLPAFEDERGVTEGDITILLLLTSVLAGVGSVVAERIALARSSGFALRLAMLTISVMVIVVGLVESVGAMYVVFALYGIGVGAVDASMNMQGVTVQKLYGRSIMTSFHGVWSIGAIVAAGYAGLTVLLDLTLRPTLILVGVLGIVLTLAVGRRFVTAAGLEHGAEVAADPEHVPHLRVPWQPILALGLVIVVFYLADTSVMSWSTLYLHDALDAAEAIAPFGYAAYQAGAVVSRLTGDLFVRRYGAVAVVRAGTLIGFVALLGVVAAPSTWFVIVAFGVMGLGLPVIVPLAFAAAGTLPDSDADVAIARLNIFNYVGNIVGAALIGAIATGDGLRWIFVVPLVLVPLILLVARAFAPRETASRAAPRGA
ncbi:sugar phosphate permease [Mumia flava]|uniref:Sugar phosphate permease n=1 Tax=Mumia flava TaxID=1348852 RepID=A0A0B2BNG7_9ACTN|nr:MFS transporter [Mumia flava]PJJ57300.1 sugar phosphate permease [Mumia flava]